MRVSVGGGILQGTSVTFLDERLRHWLGELDNWKKKGECSDCLLCPPAFACSSRYQCSVRRAMLVIRAIMTMIIEVQ